MTRYVLGAGLALVLCAPQVHGEVTEQNHTLRGDGYVDGLGRNRRTSLREARMTLRDNGYFAVTLFANGQRVLVVGRWDGRRDGDQERFTVQSVGGEPFSGNGTVYYRARRGDQPTRLNLQGRSRSRVVSAALQSDDDRDGWDDDRRDRDDKRRGRDDKRRGRDDNPRGRDDNPRGRDDNRGDRGTGNARIVREIDVTSNGRGTIRMPWVRDGDFSALRLRLQPNGQFRIDIRDRANGTIEGEVDQYDGARMVLRVRRAMGVNVRGDLTLSMRNSVEVERAYGSGTGDRGSWQLDFAGDGRSTYPIDRRRDDRYDDGRSIRIVANERGRGTIRQDDGPDLSFDRARVSIERDRDAVIVLEGRNTIRLRGTAQPIGNGNVRIDLTSVNEMRARGTVDVDVDGQRVRSFNGSGTTDRGRFSVDFRR